MSEKQTKWQWEDEKNPQTNKTIKEDENFQTYSSVADLIKNEPDVVVEIISTTNNFDESEQEPMKNISVGLYGNTEDESLEEKIEQIKVFLT